MSTLVSPEQITALHAYSACDISDALLKLKVPGAGFLPDILPLGLPSTNAPKIIAPASTVLFVPKSTASFPNAASSNPIGIISSSISQPLPNIADGAPYADLVPPHTIAVLSQPAGQSCAVMGGIMAVRLAKLGVRAALVDGRVRDLGTIAQVRERGAIAAAATAATAVDGGEEGGVEGMEIWAKGTSIIGAGAETRAWSIGVDVHVGGTTVRSVCIFTPKGSEKNVANEARAISS
jgi:regulator of RNase E activity RraA